MHRFSLARLSVAAFWLLFVVFIVLGGWDNDATGIAIHLFGAPWSLIAGFILQEGVGRIVGRPLPEQWLMVQWAIALLGMIFNSVLIYQFVRGLQRNASVAIRR